MLRAANDGPPRMTDSASKPSPAVKALRIEANASRLFDFDIPHSSLATSGHQGNWKELVFCQFQTF